MSYRDDCMIDSPEEAKDWLDRYRHTITDPQVLKVIEQLEVEYRDGITAQECRIDALENETVDLTEEIERIMEAAEIYDVDLHGDLTEFLTNARNEK